MQGRVIVPRMKKLPAPFPLLLVSLLLVFVLPLCATESLAAAKKKRSTAKKKPRPPLALVWHAETGDGQVIASQAGDEPINPASVVKVATTLWAMERLGPDHRFTTEFLGQGALDRPRGELQGGLAVRGGLDPDFQTENALIVAWELNQRGVKTVRGPLIVDRAFWIGWEGGSARREPDPAKRALTMATRLRQAWEPATWNAATKRAWQELAARRGWDPARPPRVKILKGIAETSPLKGEELVIHRSPPLAQILRRLNAYSNNDIERVGESLGTPAELGAWLEARWGLPPGSVRLETTSGLGTNRLTPRQVVGMLRDLTSVCARYGLPVESVLASAGCDPGTVSRFYQKIANGSPSSVVGKTGTLTHTDGGISVFAGYASTAGGEVLFCVAAPRAAGRLKQARWQEEQWLVDLVGRQGGPVYRGCSDPLAGPDTGAQVFSTGPAPPAPEEFDGLSPAPVPAGARQKR